MLEDLSLAPEPRPAPAARTRAPGSLNSLNLDQELFDRYMEAKTFLSDILADSGGAEGSGTPANQVAQVMNTITAILKDITKMQVELYSAERLKSLEYCLVETVKTLDQATQAAFFARYEELLGRQG